MIKVLLDGSQIHNKEEFYEAIGNQLQAPDYFGNNLDALHDILSEYEEPIEVNIENFIQLRNALKNNYLVLFFMMIIDDGGTIHILS